MIGILVEVEVAAYPYSPSCDKWFFLMQKDTMKILLYSKVAAIQQHPEWAQCSHTLMRVESVRIISSLNSSLLFAFRAAIASSACRVSAVASWCPYGLSSSGWFCVFIAYFSYSSVITSMNFPGCQCTGMSLSGL